MNRGLLGSGVCPALPTPAGGTGGQNQTRAELWDLHLRALPSSQRRS